MTGVQTCALPISPSAARTAANMSGPTTVAPSAVLQVVQTLTMTGPPGGFAEGLNCRNSTSVESEESSSALSRSITGSHQGRRRPRALLGRARRLTAVELAPVRCTPPRRRLQSTVRDGRSPGSRVVAISRLPGNSQWHRRGLVAYSCGGSAGVESPRFENVRTGFPFHLPRGRTIADDASWRLRRGQPGMATVDLMAVVASGRPKRKGTRCRPI